MARLGARMSRGAALGIVLLADCGGGSTGPSAPPMPSPSPVTRTMDGVTGGPIPAVVEAQVGRVKVDAPGYLSREQPPGDVFLWPAPDVDYVRYLIYGEFSRGGRLNRWIGGPFVSCGLDRPEITSTLDLMTLSTGITRGTGACNVTWEINPQDPEIVDRALAVTYRTWRGFGISAVRVVFRDEDAIRSSAAHEGGHILGFGHSSERSDVMFPNSSRTSQVFSSLERVQLTMMYLRRSVGNEWPDRDPGLAPADLRPGHDVVVEVANR